MAQILAASKNKHKIVEFQEMLRINGLDITILSPATIPGFPELIENGTTFEANSAMKAEQASHFADTTAFADDSGLAVDALDGAPGIYSARYAGEKATDQDRINKLLKEMNGKKDRSAKFVCVISIAHKGRLIASFRGEVKGMITHASAGENGFGYDPVFVPDGYDKTFAELGAEIKDRISHRANAFLQAVEFLKKNTSANGVFAWE